MPPLYEFDLDTQLHEWLDCRLASFRPMWEAHESLDDDSLPCAFPAFGIAEHGAWLGMDVHLQERTCLPIPNLVEKSDLAKLKLSEDDRWFRYMRDGYEYLRGKQDGDFILACRGTMTPMDIANLARGNDLFTDFLLDPKFAHELMAFLVEAVRWYYSHLISWCDQVENGHVFMHMNSWMGPNCLGHLSNDAAMLCSPAVYEEFGFPYECKLVEGFDQVLYHVHNEQMHWVPAVTKLPNLKLLEMSRDPGTENQLEDLPRIYESAPDTNLLLHANAEQIFDHIEELKERNVFIDARCKDRQEAERVVQFVREHSLEL